MFEEVVSPLSIWSALSSWLTPTVLFLLLNLMIGTIAFTSGFTSHKPSHQNNTSSTYPSNTNNNNNNHHYQHPQVQNYLQTQLTRTTTVLQRLKSINFNNFYPNYLHNTQPTYQTHTPEPEPTPVQETIKTLQQNEEKNEKKPENRGFALDENTDDDDEGPTMDEIYSKIIQKNNGPSYGRQNSDTKPVGGEVPVRLPRKIKKSASDKSAFGHFEVAEVEGLDQEVKVIQNGTKYRGGFGASVVVEEEEVVLEQPKRKSGVDEAADDFINKFREDLKMQRMASILRYKDMITRGSGR